MFLLWAGYCAGLSRKPFPVVVVVTATAGGQYRYQIEGAGSKTDISGLVGCLVVGVMSFFSLDVVKAARIIDTMISVTAIAGVSE